MSRGWGRVNLEGEKGADQCAESERVPVCDACRSFDLAFAVVSDFAMLFFCRTRR